MRKYKVDDDCMLVYISVNQYSQCKRVFRKSNEMIKYPFPFTEVRKDYFNDPDMVVCEFNTNYHSGLFKIFNDEGLHWLVELVELEPENE